MSALSQRDPEIAQVIADECVRQVEQLEMIASENYASAAVLEATDHPEEAWQWVRFLATPFYQQHFAKIGLWIPNQSSMLTEEGLKGWITEGIHPENYSQFATDYLTAHGVAVRLPVVREIR